MNWYTAMSVMEDIGHPSATGHGSNLRWEEIELACSLLTDLLPDQFVDAACLSVLQIKNVRSCGQTLGTNLVG